MALIVADGLTFVRVARRVRQQIGQRHRYAHVLRVTRFAVRLARVHGVDAHLARTAALLHDLARLYPGDRLIAECRTRGLAIDAFEMRNPVVLHARLGAELAHDCFGVTDTRVLDAIRRHTVAGDEMTPLDCVIFLADGLEPGRAFSDRGALAELAMRDLDAAMRTTLHSTIAYLRSRGHAISPQSIAALGLFAREAHA